MSTDTVTLVTFVLDETGSMESIKDDTIGGFNAYLESLKDPQYGAVEFTLLKFDSNRVNKVYVGAPIADVQPLTPATYRPGASTPLIDASVKAIKATADLVASRTDTPHVLVVIQTDGQENASHEYTLQDLQALVKEHTAAGWAFVFLGAGIDAFRGAQMLGISTANALSYGRGKTHEAFHSLYSNTKRYRGTGHVDDLTFSTAQRTSAGDTFHQPQTPTPGAPPAAAATEVRSAPRRSIVDDIDLAKKD